MKSELLHLLDKLKADHPDFKSLMIFQNGSARVVGNQSHRQFANLDALEAYAWPQETVGSTDPVAPSAQDKVGPAVLSGPLPTVELNPPATIGYVVTPIDRPSDSIEL